MDSFDTAYATGAEQTKTTFGDDLTQPKSVATLVTTKSDNDIALDLKARLTAVSEQLIPIIDEACSHKINVSIQINRDAFGRLQIGWQMTKEVGI